MNRRGESKTQSGTELLTTYGFIILIIVIAIALLFVFSKAPSNTIPSSCSIYGTLGCSDLVYGTNSAGVSTLVMLASLQEQGVLNISTFNAVVSGVDSSSGYCSTYYNNPSGPKTLYEGNSIYCFATFPTSVVAQQAYTGTFTITGAYCSSTRSPCISNSASSYVFTGSFTTKGVANIIISTSSSVSTTSTSSISTTSTTTIVIPGLSILLFPPTATIQAGNSVAFTNKSYGGTGNYVSFSYRVLDSSSNNAIQNGEASESGNTITFGTAGSYSVVESVTDNSGATASSAPSTIFATAPIVSNPCLAFTANYITFSISTTDATPVNYTLRINFSAISPAYSPYETANLGNIRFFNGAITQANELYSWCETGCASSNTLFEAGGTPAYNSIFWIKLPNAIPAGGSMAINALFAQASCNYLSDGTYAGENPYWTDPYGKYDNGASVFPYYYNMLSYPAYNSLLPGLQWWLLGGEKVGFAGYAYTYPQPVLVYGFNGPDKDTLGGAGGTPPISLYSASTAPGPALSGNFEVDAIVKIDSTAGVNNYDGSLAGGIGASTSTYNGFMMDISAVGAGGGGWDDIGWKQTYSKGISIAQDTGDGGGWENNVWYHLAAIYFDNGATATVQGYAGYINQSQPLSKDYVAGVVGYTGYTKDECENDGGTWVSAGSGYCDLPDTVPLDEVEHFSVTPATYNAITFFGASYNGGGNIDFALVLARYYVALRPSIASITTHLVCGPGGPACPAPPYVAPAITLSAAGAVGQMVNLPSGGGSVTFTNVSTGSATPFSFSYRVAGPPSGFQQTGNTITFTASGSYSVTESVQDSTGSSSTSNPIMVTVSR